MHFLIAILLCANPAMKAHDLQLNLKIGETYSQNFTSEVFIKQQIMGMDQKIETEISYELDFLVTDLEGEWYQMTVHYRKMEMQITAAMGQFTMSSEGVTDPGDITASLMSHLVDKPFSAQMSKNGRLRKIEGLEEVIESVFENYPEASEMEIAQLRTQLEQGYGENSFRGNMELITAVLPEKPVEVGESWTRKLEIKTTMPLVSESTFELKEVTSSAITIDGTGTMQISDAVQEINGMAAKYVTTGTNTSRIQLDPASKWISSAEIQQKMEGEVEILADDSLPEGLKFPLIMEITTTIAN